MYMAYKHSNRFCWNVPTWCSWASRVQASHHGVQLPAQSSACVPRGIVPTSHRCSIMATSLIRHPSAPMTDGLTVWLVRRPGIPCRTACGIRILEATVSDNLWRCFCSQRTDAFSALEVSRRIDDALYKSTFYLLTYLLKSMQKLASGWLGGLSSVVGGPGWRTVWYEVLITVRPHCSPAAVLSELNLSATDFSAQDVCEQPRE